MVEVFDTRVEKALPDLASLDFNGLSYLQIRQVPVSTKRIGGRHGVRTDEYLAQATEIHTQKTVPTASITIHPAM